MKFRLIFAAGLLALGGCATYDYTGGGSGGYYRGAPAVQYRYPPGYSRISTATRTVCRMAMAPGRSACTTTRCTRFIVVVATTTGSTIDVRSTVRRARTARSTTGRAPRLAAATTQPPSGNRRTAVAAATAYRRTAAGHSRDPAANRTAHYTRTDSVGR